MHAILTFRRHVGRIANLHTRDLHFLYSKFGDRFDIIDLRDVVHEDISPYEVILVDNRCLNIAMRESRFDFAKFEDRLVLAKGTKVLLAGDMHNWSFFNGQHPTDNTTQQTDVRAELEGYGELLRFVQKTGIQFLISLYACPEAEQIKKLCNFQDVYILGNHINTNIYRDYQRKKIRDVLIYGAADPRYYSFRARVRDLIFDSDLNYLRHRHHHEISQGKMLPPKDLAKLINESWLCLATVSNYDYFVEKYFEIAACNSVVLGNMNEQGRTIWESNFIEINPKMTDSTIMDTIKKSLEDKQLLQQILSKMCRKIASGYSLPQCKDKLFSICESIAERVTSSRAPVTIAGHSLKRGCYAIKSIAKCVMSR